MRKAVNYLSIIFILVFGIYLMVFSSGTFDDIKWFTFIFILLVPLLYFINKNKKSTI